MSHTKAQKGAHQTPRHMFKSASDLADAVVSSPSYNKMKYKELQSLCKELGIKANEKKAVLVEALKNWHASEKAKEQGADP